MVNTLSEVPNSYGFMGKRAHINYPLYRETAEREKVIGRCFSLLRVSARELPRHSPTLKNKLCNQPYSRLPSVLPIISWTATKGVRTEVWVWLQSPRFVPTAMFLGDTRLAADRADMRLLLTRFTLIVQLVERLPRQWRRSVVRVHFGVLMLVLRCGNALCFP